MRLLHKALLWQCLLATGVLFTALLLAAQAAGQRITLYITDFGINQWNDQLILGADFTHVTNRVLPPSDSRGQILVPMPSDHELETLSTEELTQRIAYTVQSKVEAGIPGAHPVTTFEIQLVQNINTGGYFDPERQRKVDEFGAAAYTAIGRVIEQLTSRNIEVASYAIAGSNGTKMLAANVDRLFRQGKTYLQGVDLFDGRAFMTPVIRLIETVGQENVRIFTTRTDWPAPYTPFGLRSIANFDTVANLKDRFPRLKTYVLFPKVPVPNPLLSHVAGMAKHDSQFSIQEYIGHGFMRTLEPQELSGHALLPIRRGNRWTHPLDGHATQGALRPRVKDVLSSVVRAPQDTEFSSKVKVSTEAIEALATAILAYASVLTNAEQETLRKLPLFRHTTLSAREQAVLRFGTYVQSAYAVAQAVREDLEVSARGEYPFLRSQTLEALGYFGLDTLKFLQLEDMAAVGKFTKGVFNNLDGSTELVLALSKTTGRRAIDFDSASHYLDAMEAFAAVPFAAEQSRLKTLAPGLGRQLPWVAVLSEALRAVHLHHERQHVDPDVVTRYADVYIQVFWTGVGLWGCQREYTCVKAVQAFGTAFSHTLRELTAAPIQRLVLFTRRQRQQALEQWYATQQRNITLGLPVLPISRVYGVDLLKSNGFREAEILKLDHTVADYNAKLASVGSASAPVDQSDTALAAAPRAQRFNRDVGGVKMRMNEPEVEHVDLSPLRNAVLDTRRRRQSLSSDLP